MLINLVGKVVVGVYSWDCIIYMIIELLGYDMIYIWSGLVVGYDGKVVLVVGKFIIVVFVKMINVGF